MKTLTKTTLLSVVLTITIASSAFAGSPACLSVYSKHAVPLAKTKIESVKLDVWDLNHELGKAKEVAIPARWKSMVENNNHVEYRYTEKTFERQTIQGTKYTVSYHVVEPANGKYKSTIVLQHGFAESAIYFKTMTKVLVTMGFRVIGMDGANAGHTLLRTLQTRKRHLRSPSPVEDGLALAEVIRLEVPKPEKFIILGHSRGFAVSSLALATGLFDNQLIQHISSNGYDSWKVDSMVDKQVYNPFILIPGVGQFLETFAVQLRNIIRRQTNRVADPLLRNTVNNHQVMKTKQEVGIELSEEVTRMFLTEVTMEIAEGLKGADISRHGYDNLPLYDVTLDLASFDNGFGLVNPKARIKIKHLSKSVKEKTTMVFGDSDKLITPVDSKPIIDSITSKPIMLKTDEETGIAATHFLPNERPFDLIEVILNAYKYERAQAINANP